MKSRILIIEFEMFSGYVVHVEITSNLEKAMKKYPPTRVVPKEDIGHAMAVHVVDDAMTFVFLPYNASVGTIAHESWHVVKRMVDYLGIKVDNETVAYLLGYLVNKIFKFARGRK